MVLQGETTGCGGASVHGKLEVAGQAAYDNGKWTVLGVISILTIRRLICDSGMRRW